MKRASTITESAIAAACFAVLLLLIAMIPIVNIIGLFFLPLPMIIYVVRHGLQAALPLFVATLLISFLIAGPIGLGLACVFSIGGAVTGALYRRRQPAFYVLLGTSLAYTVALMAVFVMSAGLFHIHIIDQSVQVMNETIDKAVNMGASLGENTTKGKADLKEQLSRLRYLTPFLVMFTGAVIALITQLVAGAVLKRLGYKEEVSVWLPFRDWHFPKKFLWYYLIILVIGLFQPFSEGSTWYSFYMNLFVILELVMLLQGVTFIFFYAHRKNMHKGVPIAVVVVSLLATPLLPLGALIRILGIIDIGFDLRARLEAK